MVKEVNDLFLETIGKEKSALSNTPYWVINAEAAAICSPITGNMLQTGTSFHPKEHEMLLILSGSPQIVYVNFVYKTIRNFPAVADTVMIVVIDTSPQLDRL